jgi:hypothetical protein
VIDKVSVPVPCEFVRTNPVQVPHAVAHVPRIAEPTSPLAALTVPDPAPAAVACQACAQQFDAVADADPRAENVSPVAVGVEIVLAVSSVIPRTRIRSPAFHVRVPVTSGTDRVSVHVDVVLDVSVGAGMTTPTPHGYQEIVIV